MDFGKACTLYVIFRSDRYILSFFSFLFLGHIVFICIWGISFLKGHMGIYFSIRTLTSRLEELVVNHAEYCLISNAWILQSQLVEQLNSHKPSFLCLVRSAFGHKWNLHRFWKQLHRGASADFRRAKTYHWINVMLCTSEMKLEMHVFVCVLTT